jgi:hypothetical protein
MDSIKKDKRDLIELTERRGNRLPISDRPEGAQDEAIRDGKTRSQR